MTHFYINFPAFLLVVFSFPALDKLLQSTHEQDFRQSSLAVLAIQNTVVFLESVPWKYENNFTKRLKTTDFLQDARCYYTLKTKYYSLANYPVKP